MKKAIFISSTFKDLKTYRRRVWELLENYNVDVRGMEKFGARKEAPLVTCISEVEQCDIFIGIIAHRLGSIDEATGKSFTQVEYEKAKNLAKDVLIYLIDDTDAKVSYENIDFNENREKLLAFKASLKTNHTVDFFVSEEDLTEKLKARLATLLASKEELNNMQVDEFAHAKDMLNKFVLLPALYSGREVKLLLEFQGDPFPASKSICSNFNLEYGSTIGVKVNIKQPEISNSLIEYAFIDRNSIEKFFSISDKTDVLLYGKLQFSENKIVKVRANFVFRNYITMRPIPSINIPSFSPFEKTTEEAEGQIILKITRFV